MKTLSSGLLRPRRARPFGAASALALGSSLLSCFVASPALADEVPSLDLRGLFAPLSDGAGLTLESVASPETGDVTGSLRVTYATQPITLERPNGELAYAVVSHQVTGDVGLAVGIAEILTLGLDLPVLLGQVGDDLSGDSDAYALVGGAPIASTSLGDPALRAKLSIVTPARSDKGVARGFGLALDERFTLPLGDERSFIAEGAVTSATWLSAELGAGPIVGLARAGFKARADEGSFACSKVEACGSRFGHSLPFGHGASFYPSELGLDPDGRWSLFAEVFGHLPMGPVLPDESIAPWALDAALGGRLRFGDVTGFAALRTSLVDAVGSTPFALTLGFSVAPREKDSDRDGVRDGRDRCPDWAEDADGFEDADGCPEMDNDADGAPDVQDAAPNDPLLR